MTVSCVPGSGDACPSCRSPALARPIRNIDLDAVCQSLHPDEYQRRYKEMRRGEVPKTWEDHPAFCGEAITYRG